MPQQNRLSLKLLANPAHARGTASQNLRHRKPHHTYNSEHSYERAEKNTHGYDER